MYILMKDLCYELSKYAKVLIYGAGNYANLIYMELKKVGFKDKIESFLVTSVGDVKAIDGIAVKAASELALYDKEKCIVLLAVNRKNEKEIAQMIKQNYGLINEIKLLDYIKQEDFDNKLRMESDNCFFEQVIDCYTWDHINLYNEFENKRKVAEALIDQRNRKGIDKNTIVFISGDIKPRSEKIIGALVQRRYHIVVLEYGFCNDLFREEIRAQDIDFFHCEDKIEVYYMALQYSPLVYYFEPLWEDCSVSEIMIRHKALFGKIIFAPCDVLNDGYVQISEKDKLSERYCLENADGVVWRWFSKDFLEQKKGFVYKGKSIQFLDYCKGVETDKNNKVDDIVKICFVQGGIYEYLDETVFANNGVYAESARIDTILNKLGNVRDCIFHMFIGRCDDINRKKIEKLEKKYSNFKVFYGIKYNEMIVKISEYDYGCLFMTGGKEIPELESIDNVYYGSAYINGVANRFFDYLDANIPIITTAEKKQCQFLERYGVIIPMNICNIDLDYLKKNKLLYKKNVVKAKAELLIDNHIQRLIDFFKEL